MKRDEYATLRAEIKSWERDFKAQHGRGPTVEEIKELPELADKYRRYKKLSKVAESRPAENTQPLPGFNPFSPTKSKERTNGTLSKGPRLKPFVLDVREPSPSFGGPSASTSHASDIRDPFITTPISRARKRLRGEPVSPSPSKDKRRRIVASGGDSDDDMAGTASFIADSPVKLPAGGRSFQQLFDETTAAKPAFPALHGKRPNANLLLSIGARSRPRHDQSVFPASLPPEPALSSQGEDDPFIDKEPTKAKVAILDDEMVVDAPAQQIDSIPSEPLLPPSPTAQQAKALPAPHLKGKGKAGPGPKKANLTLGDDSDSDSEMYGTQPAVRMFDRTASTSRVLDSDMDEDAFNLMPKAHFGMEDDGDPVPTSSEAILLPDSLRAVLSLAPTIRDVPDEGVAKHLLSGDRGYYDAVKGGEVWGVGEFGDEEQDEFAAGQVSRAAQGIYDEEDEWEGEGVPWEVGEM